MEDILLIDFYTKPYITSLSNYFSSPYILVLYEIIYISKSRASPNCLQEAVDKLLQHTFWGIAPIILILNQFFLTNWMIFV